MALAARTDDTQCSRCEQDQPVVPGLRELLRRAIDKCGWKHDALAEVLGVCDRYYLSKMLAGEKAITTKHLEALPDDIEAHFAKLYAEKFKENLVLERVTEDEALRQLLTGIAGVIEGLPRKRMAKAEQR